MYDKFEVAGYEGTALWYAGRTGDARGSKGFSFFDGFHVSASELEDTYLVAFLLFHAWRVPFLSPCCASVRRQDGSAPRLKTSDMRGIVSTTSSVMAITAPIFAKTQCLVPGLESGFPALPHWQGGQRFARRFLFKALITAPGCYLWSFRSAQTASD